MFFTTVFADSTYQWVLTRQEVMHPSAKLVKRIQIQDVFNSSCLILRECDQVLDFLFPKVQNVS